MSLYTDIVAAGIPFDHHASDLHFPITAQSSEILARYELQNKNAQRFTSKVDGKQWYDVPSSYDPYWIAHRVPRE